MKRGGGINFKGLFGGLGKGRRGKGKREGEERGGSIPDLSGPGVGH